MAPSTSSFARGNLSKLLKAPRYAVGEAKARRARRDPDRWVFGSNFGVADGALELLRHVRVADPQTRVTWIAATPEEARAARAEGALAVLKGTPRAEEETLAAGVIVLTHGFGDVARYSCTGALIVQLWHGTPLKRLHIDSPAVLTLPIIGSIPGVQQAVAWMYAKGTRRICVVPVSSSHAQRSMSTAFDLPTERVPVLGEPRVDVLLRGSPEGRERRARELLEKSVGPLGGRRTVLHAATWRDGRGDPSVPTAEEWMRIEQWCARTGSVLIVRPHPLAGGEYTHTSDSVRLLSSSDHPALNPVLAAIDVLITDYSSTLVDFSLLARPVVFFAGDLDEYTRSRGLYVDYDMISDGRAVADWGAVLQRLDDVIEPGPERERVLGHVRAIADRFHEHRDGRSTARVYAHIRQVLRQGESPRDDELIVRDSVFFESFYGRSAACNPLALDREIARRRPDLERFWSVADETVSTPPGSRPVVIGTPEWHRARDESRLVVLNDWIRDDWSARPSQFVLQTWHGTPLKRLALSRSNRTPRQVAAVLKQSGRWSALLAQSPWAAKRLRRAYGYHGPVWVSGYPRDDDLVHPVSRSCPSLGLPPGRRVVLYAPTWRDGHLDAPDPLNAVELAERLGPTWCVLVRGHSRTAAVRSTVRGDGVIDVTSHPDVTQLLRCADVLVTDYSSVMFDFAVTGRPMVFYVPDLDEYGSAVRGFYFDLAEQAPGPLVATVEDLAVAVRSAGHPEEVARWKERYDRWQTRYLPREDGAAAARVVDLLEGQGVL